MNKLHKPMKEMTLKQLQKINHESWVEIQEKQNAKADKETRKFVGKYYKYKNCYSCPQEEKDYFWIYTHIIKAEDGRLRAFEFQKDSYGKITIEDNRETFFFDEKYIECTVEEFYREWQNMMDNINLPSGLIE